MKGSIFAAIAHVADKWLSLEGERTLEKRVGLPDRADSTQMVWKLKHKLKFDSFFITFCPSIERLLIQR